jgi:hypothetical protein
MCDATSTSRHHLLQGIGWDQSEVSHVVQAGHVLAWGSIAFEKRLGALYAGLLRSHFCEITLQALEQRHQDWAVSHDKDCAKS